DAALQVVAGRLNVVSDFQGLADPPEARPLRLTCYPLGSTATGTPIDHPLPPAPAPPPPPMAARESIVVTGMRQADLAAAPARKAVEAALGDLKLYRVPEPVTVAAKSLKQVAFLDEEGVEGRLLYTARCPAWDAGPEALAAGGQVATVNVKQHGLGSALPRGGVTVFEPTSFGEELVAAERVRDYAEVEEVQLALGTSSQVFAHFETLGEAG